jgi:hypothetical protein
LRRLTQQVAGSGFSAKVGVQVFADLSLVERALAEQIHRFFREVFGGAAAAVETVLKTVVVVDFPEEFQGIRIGNAIHGIKVEAVIGWLLHEMAPFPFATDPQKDALVPRPPSVF